jgi:hypothetical protein
MRIELVRRGGFTGRTLMSSIDTEALSPDDAADAVEAVAALRAVGTTASNPTAGVPRYEFTITNKSERYAVDLSEGEIPEIARPLIARLKEQERPH